jgi:hypothetical protein
VLDAIKLDIIIVGANPQLSKTFYAAEWNPDAEATAPDCFSLNGVSPDPQSTQLQNDVCASCPSNSWGSRITKQGTKVKACSDLKRLAVVSADDPSGSVFLLSVTPAALKGLNQYQRELGMRGIAPEIVRTTISFDTNASFPKLQFGFGGFISEEAQTAVDKLFGTEQVLEITGEGTGATAVTVNTPETVKAEPTPEPTPEPVAETKTTGFGTGTSTAAPAETKAAEPVAETKATGFGTGTSTAAAPTETVAPAEEPAAAPAADADAGTAGLAEEITALMAEVADDA